VIDFTVVPADRSELSPELIENYMIIRQNFIKLVMYIPRKYLEQATGVLLLCYYPRKILLRKLSLVLLQLAVKAIALPQDCASRVQNCRMNADIFLQCGILSVELPSTH
jgi:hypothetical protein